MNIEKMVNEKINHLKMAIVDNEGSDMESYLEGRLSAFEDVLGFLSEETKR